MENPADKMCQLNSRIGVMKEVFLVIWDCSMADWLFCAALVQ